MYEDGDKYTDMDAKRYQTRDGSGALTRKATEEIYILLQV